MIFETWQIVVISALAVVAVAGGVVASIRAARDEFERRTR